VKRLLVVISATAALAAVGSSAPAVAQPPCDEQQAQVVADVSTVATDDEAVANEEAAFQSATDLRDEASANVTADRAAIAAQAAVLKAAEEEGNQLAIIIAEKILKADEVGLAHDLASLKQDAAARKAQAGNLRAAKTRLHTDYKQLKADESALNACLKS
jgi:hypothetical protein